MIEVTINDTKKKYKEPVTGLEIAKEVGIKDALAMKIDGELADLFAPNKKNANI